MSDAMLQDHDELRAISSELRGILLDGRMPIGRQFATIRWMLTRRLLHHIAMESHVIQSDGAKAFEQRYRDHVVAWTSERIDTEWRTYRREMLAILDTLDQRMAAEERDFYKPVRAPGGASTSAQRHPRPPA